jgi:outer membrane protein OmpA-like peptidoglycan-associated protein
MQKYYRLVFMSCSFLISPLAMAENCMPLQQKIREAHDHNNLPALKQLQNSMRLSACPADHKTYAERQLAALMYKQLLKRETNEQRLVQGMLDILRKNPFYWPALASLGDYYHEKNNSLQAIVYFSRAIEAIKDESKTPQADVPPRQFLEDLLHKAELAQLDAETDAPEKIRATGAGAMSFKVRSMESRGKNIPIHFPSGRKNLAGKDLHYAKRLYKTLSKQGQPNITLIGHTDPVGRETDNLRLSKERATTVKQFLKRNGYNGRIKSSGRGEDKKLYDPRGNPIKHYGKRRWYRMLRRVEVIKNQ